MELKNIAILGPGGNVGSAIITKLLTTASPYPFSITAITRPTSTYTRPPHTSPHQIIHKTVDYGSESCLEAVFTDQDAVVNCITGSATQYATSRLIIDAAIAAGVKFFFANEFVGNVLDRRFLRLPEAVVGAKVRIRRDLEGLGDEGKIVWTSLNGGPFMDMWLTKGPAGFSPSTSHARIYAAGTKPLYWTPLPTIALAAVNMLRNPLSVANRAVHICPFITTATTAGPESKLTQRALLLALEQVLGTAFTEENVDIACIHRSAMKVLERYEAGLPEAKEKIGLAVRGLALCNQFYDEEEEDGDGDDVRNGFGRLVANELVGVETMEALDAVRDAVERYGRDCVVVESMFRVEACEV